MRYEGAVTDRWQISVTVMPKQRRRTEVYESKFLCPHLTFCRKEVTWAS